MTVREIEAGTFVWDEDDLHSGVYTAEWLTGEDREAARLALDIKPEDF